MRMRRGSLLSGKTFGAAILQYKPGDTVKSILVDDHYFSGVVREVDTKTNKITVAWGGGPVSQHDVDEIMPGPGDVNYGAGKTKEIEIKASQGRRMRAGLGDVIDPHPQAECPLCDVMSTSGDEPPAQQPAWVIQDGPQESSVISSDLRRGRFSADPSMDNFLGKPGTHGINTPRGGGFSIMEDLQKDLHQESNDLAGVHASDKQAAMPDVDKIMKYENGEMDEDETVEFFQDLIDSGMIYHLQGSYGRMAQHLIQQGLCHRKGQTASDKTAVSNYTRNMFYPFPSPAAQGLGQKTGGQKYRGYTIEKSGDNFYVKDPSGHRAFGEVPVSIETAKKWIDQDIYDNRKKASDKSKKAAFTKCPHCHGYMDDEEEGEWLGEDGRGVGWFLETDTCPTCGYSKTYKFSERGETKDVKITNPGKTIAASNEFGGLKSRRAMYWTAPDRTFRLTRQEQETGQAICPKCQIPMEKEPFTRSDKLLICPQCRFKVPTSKAVNRVEIKVPAGVEVDVTTQEEGCDDEVIMANTRRGRFAAVDPSTLANLPRMSVKDIAGLISDDWKSVNFAARPYLDAMYSLNSVSDMYMADTGTSVVAYFLCNASSWRGEVAKAVKKELQRRIR